MCPSTWKREDFGRGPCGSCWWTLWRMSCYEEGASCKDLVAHPSFWCDWWCVDLWCLSTNSKTIFLERNCWSMNILMILGGSNMTRRKLIWIIVFFSILLFYYFLWLNNECYVNLWHGSMMWCFSILNDVIMLDLFSHEYACCSYDWMMQSIEEW